MMSNTFAAATDVRRSLHVGSVPMPELVPDEALVAVMTSSINYNTVWSATFEPVPTFRFSSSSASKVCGRHLTTDPTRWSARTRPVSSCV